MRLFKTIVFFIVCFLSSTKENLCAQYATNVIVTDIANVTLSKNMEQEASKLLTVFNDAYYKDTQPDLQNVKDKVKISAIWGISPLKCIETEIIVRGYTTKFGYQIRNIPMFLKDVTEEDAERDIVINFDMNGIITDIYFCINVGGFLEEANEVTELKRRLELIDFLEKFFAAYYFKDIKAVSDKFSYDDQIISGRVTKVTGEDGIVNEETTFTHQTKEEYINKLKEIFANNKTIDMKFEAIELQQHPKYNHIYGVTFSQVWNTTNYRDIVFVFLYIDFRDENNPLIKRVLPSIEQINRQSLNAAQILDQIFN